MLTITEPFSMTEAATEIQPKMTSKPNERGPELAEKKLDSSTGPNGISSSPNSVDDDRRNFVRQMVNVASPNALRLALYQINGDPDLALMRITKVKIRGGALFDYVLSPQDEEVVRTKAVEFLLNKPVDIPPPPTVSEAHKLMNLFAGVKIARNDILPGYEELAFDDYPRGVEWSSPDGPPAGNLSEFRVLIIGAGLSGIAAAIQLKRLGIPYTIIERQSDIGGTWLWNDYPEARVDTLSYLFQYKFEKNYKWSELFASREETQKYLRHVVEKHNVQDGFNFNKEVVKARWNEQSATWSVEYVDKLTGAREVTTAKAVISASGLFSTPNLPDIKGIHTFKGHIFHTTNWNHSVDFRGMRAAVIGTGSTGTQLTPGLAAACKSVSVFQRSPNWIVSIQGYKEPVQDSMHWLCDNMPYYWNWYCYAAYFRSLDLAPIQLRDHDFEAKGGRVNQRNEDLYKSLVEYVHTKMADKPELIPKLIPKYAPLVRRLVVDNGFYDALKEDHVELITDGIDRITERGILTKDGVEHEFDMIVLGAGFKTSHYFFPVEYIGKGGLRLEDCWKKDGARSYLGMVNPGFPNFFSLYGPNHQPRGGSLYSWAEIWARYAVRAVKYLVESGKNSMDVRSDVYEEYQKKLDMENEKLIWESEGAGYYVNEHGRQAVNMPWTTSVYHEMVIEPNPDDFVFS